jgi:phosphonopyruvate decarboxylase
MEIAGFIKLINKADVGFYAGVPDSQLWPLCDYLINTYGVSDKHIIAVNEGNAVALAAGYHLSTGKIPCVYLQNSGLGNIVNPVASLLSDRVYGIPCIFVVGWRGEPSVKDEPQHLLQGEITLQMLDVMGIEHIVIDEETTECQLEDKMKAFSPLLKSGKSVAFVVRKGGLSCQDRVTYGNSYPTGREAFIRAIVDAANEGIIVSTTGKTSRELFEIRQQNGQSCIVQ